MKGLLLKDFYQIRSYYRWYLIISVVSVAISLVGSGSRFLFYYPSMFFGLIPITLLSLDEHSRWDRYSGALPYTRAQLVSSKYIVGAVLQLAALLIMICGSAVGTHFLGVPSSEMPVFRTVAMSATFAALTSVAMPFAFKFGVERGRIAYAIIIGCYAGLGVFILGYNHTISNAVICAVGICVYALSWRISAALYKGREL